MQIRSFGSLEDLNAFLASMSVENVPEDVITEGLEALKAAGINTDDAELESFTLQMDEPEAEEATIPQAALDAYIELTSQQIARLVNERDEARRAAEQEVQDHMTCHGHMDEALKRARVQGYAEALYASMKIGPHIALATEEMQSLIVGQAEREIEKMDSIYG